jgi:hypothetical protein
VGEQEKEGGRTGLSGHRCLLMKRRGSVRLLVERNEEPQTFTQQARSVPFTNVCG